MSVPVAPASAASAAGLPLVLCTMALGVLAATACFALLAGKRNRLALALGTGGAVLASAGGLAASGLALLGGRGAGVTFARPWSLPLGQLAVGMDPLSSWFVLCISVVTGLAAVNGAGYLASHHADRRLGVPVAFFQLLTAAMLGVAIARDFVLFLLAWEVMTFASYFLVTFDDDDPAVGRAGMIYLIASQLGVVPLFVLFGLFARHAGSFGFDAILLAGAPSPALAGTAFVLAVVGFGTKAGFWPLHIWLPDAHPAAPSHVSAVMSGVMIKMGLYGLLRTVMLLGPPPLWWGVLLLAIGLVSGVTGVLHALAQHDLKRLLAYHSVENIGIITIGAAIGLLGQTGGAPGIAFLGYAGALLHVLNHGLFKGLLFAGAGSVAIGTGTREIDRLGGLARRMPTTALTFLVGAVAICGLPPLNGFISEWFIYVGAFTAGAELTSMTRVLGITAMAGLALIGGLAAACFVKVYGIVFLGEPRGAPAAGAHESGTAMRVAMIAGALLCAAIGLWPWGAFALIARPAAALAGLELEAVTGLGAPATGPLFAITRTAAALVVLVAVLALMRWLLLRRREVRAAATWGCGYAHPSPRMQYTAASFAQPVLAPFAPVLTCHAHASGPNGPFPAAARAEEHFGDLARERVVDPLARRLVAMLGRTRVMQHGRLHIYLIYVLVTLIALLAWQLVARS